MFNSNINKVISSFDDLKKLSKKQLKTQSKAFDNLESWAQDSNNTAINDVTGKLSTLFKKLSDDFTKDKSGSFMLVSNIFRKFKEYDLEFKKLHKYKTSVEKKEKKYYQEIEKCPTSKNIRDFEIKYNKAKLEREKTEIKLYELGQQIDGTKSILFKRNMQSLTEALKRQNEAEKVLLNAMQDLLNQIPDVSNEEVDDISEIKYKNKKKTDKICDQAKKKLTHISSSNLGDRNSKIESEEEKMENLNEACVNLVINRVSENPSPRIETCSENKFETSSTKTRISCPPKINFLEPKIYPNLVGISEEPPLVPPPTYSDSESFYSTLKAKSSSVLPSAPCITDIVDSSSKPISFRQKTQAKKSPTRNI